MLGSVCFTESKHTKPTYGAFARAWGNMNWHKPMQFCEAPSNHAWVLQDSLTGFANPTRFLRQLGLLGPRGSVRRILLVLDIDRFRAIKNSLGYHHADALLHAVAARLRTGNPGKPLIGHLGEDAFAMVFTDFGDDPQALALTVCALLQPPFEVGGKRITMSVCIGIAAVTADPVVCLRNANTALSRAKEIGPGQVVIYDRAMREDEARSLQLQTELRAAFVDVERAAKAALVDVERAAKAALDASQTTMAYQPIVNLANGQVEGHEALMRWSSKTYGVIAPNEFIPMAERSGIAPMLDKWAFAQAILRLQKFPNAGFINVNVSACSLLESTWVDETLARFQASGLRAGQLRLEITETALLNQEATVHAHLIRLTRSGLPVILDDFGTGYSSLSHLRLFPIVGIKIDRSFVAQIVGDGREGRIVSAMTRLALDLGMSVTAEGVENSLQHATLIAIGCGFAQGHLYGFPKTDVSD